MELTLRPLREEDKPVLMKILVHLPEFTEEEVDVAEEVLDCCLDDPEISGYLVLVALLDSAVVGYVCYGPTPLTQGTWDVYWMAVAPEQQGRGIGGTLLAAAEQEIARQHGRLAVIETSSRPEYEKTRRFHVSHGYVPACEVADFYSPGDNKIILVKRFASP